MNTAITQHPQSMLRQAITAAYRCDEAGAMQALAGQLNIPASSQAKINQRARDLVTSVRRNRSQASGVDNLMQEFSLSSQEGVALMCLAEALLRIPDNDTVDRLIRDKIGRGDWRAHLGQSGSLFVNAAAWGLLITRQLVSTSSEQNLGSALTRLIARGGEPLVRKGLDLAMRLLGQQFVTGQSIAEALKRSREKEALGYRYSYDMLGEAALTNADAERYLASYTEAIHAIGRVAERRGV
ncbi:MAG: proline dehydrogenase family protein, partial [Sterolibacterium sp.]